MLLRRREGRQGNISRQQADDVRRQSSQRQDMCLGVSFPATSRWRALNGSSGQALGFETSQPPTSPGQFFIDSSISPQLIQSTKK